VDDIDRAQAINEQLQGMRSPKNGGRLFRVAGYVWNVKVPWNGREGDGK